MAEREFMEYDIVIVGAGPSGLACAIRIRQLCAERGHDLSVCVIEKGSEVGGGWCRLGLGDGPADRWGRDLARSSGDCRGGFTPDANVRNKN